MFVIPIVSPVLNIFFLLSRPPFLSREQRFRMIPDSFQTVEAQLQETGQSNLQRAQLTARLQSSAAWMDSHCQGVLSSLVLPLVPGVIIPLAKYWVSVNATFLHVCSYFLYCVQRFCICSSAKPNKLAMIPERNVRNFIA